MTAFAIPGDPETATGGYVYDRRAIAHSGGDLTLLRLPGAFPFPSEADLAEAGRLLAAADGPALIDGLAYGVLPAELIEALPHRPVALCHHPLGLEPGLAPDESRRLIAAETAALAHAAHVIVTSDATKRTLVADFAVPAKKVTVAPPGLDRTPPAAFHGAPRATAAPPTILTVASFTRRKAHDVLVAALARIAERPWRAVWVGADDLDPDWAARIRREVDSADLAGRVEINGPCDAERLGRFYDGADLFCLPSRYEGYGMVFAEAMMRGLPIVAADADAARDVIPCGAGVLPPVDDPDALAAALAALLKGAAARREMGRAGRAHALTLPGWDETWSLIRDALAEAAGRAT